MLYTVTYSGRVLDALVRLGRAAQRRGDGAQFTAALREFHRRLCIYPQFGDPPIDLAAEAGQIRLGLMQPLALRYGVLEESRAVFAVGLPVLLSRTA